MANPRSCSLIAKNLYQVSPRTEVGDPVPSYLQHTQNSIQAHSQCYPLTSLQPPVLTIGLLPGGDGGSFRTYVCWRTVLPRAKAYRDFA